MLNLFRNSQTEPSTIQLAGNTNGHSVYRSVGPPISARIRSHSLSTDDYQAQAQWLLLKELLDNGQAEPSGHGNSLSI